MSTHLSDYDYLLPEHLIAKYPPARRGDSRLLVIHRDSQTRDDRMFADIVEYLNPSDVLVLNKTKVIPARLIGKRKTGGKVEVLLHQRLEGDQERWKVLVAPARKANEGEQLFFEGLSCQVERDLGEGEKIVCFDRSGPDFLQAIEAIGQVPLPPYLHRAAEESDKERYQTIYASTPGAVAAPTAGLHFTAELLNRIEAQGVKLAYVTLHTGLGTFRPVESEDITQHRMHEEYFELDEANASIINNAKMNGGRCIAVGTTTVRALETLAGVAQTLVCDPGAQTKVCATPVSAGSGMSSIFIYPPYRFKIPDAIVTNFHLPRSTLLMMISAFADREFILRCYEHATQAGYRFFSYGDAMLIL
ncbi:MAG TPA: tRNA preQ1(34) S-adenosylmethionine ribosyltransferase-isomerase QueA [Candidatus Kapabacteria bacterium]|nr:tRNA preQ1(34) S-adenosylmethionine ribosyltransferase-isomerase QueA [Candidatus Kapabacteria bacterium]